MTNIVTNVGIAITGVVVLVLQTNWTGIYVEDGREVGIVTTNHVARVKYADSDHEWILRKVVSDQIVWKRQTVYSSYYLPTHFTNYYSNYYYFISSNSHHQF